MSLRPDGTYRCDHCDTDVVNGGHPYAVTISGPDPQAPQFQLVLHLCLPREVDGKHVPGCRDHVLTKAALRAYRAAKGLDAPPKTKVRGK